MKSRPLVRKYLTWDLGRGDEALFQDDSWDGQPPIINSRISRNSINVITNIWGPKVSDAKTLIRIDETETWVWKSLDNTNIPSIDKTILENILKGRSMNRNNLADKLIWGPSNDGIQKVKLGYDLIINSK